ncbi:histone-arginine methyltransferase METTL23-like [Apostichopus japonicus]|uniref:histone-arginine methyltransferase METTL23-like n=1 Tax=Stichopus japonicus TaxID=307972 RepID=UPI003AB36347
MAAYKNFKFQASSTEDTNREDVEVLIPEVLDPSYGMYVWPCAAVLAQFIWFHQDDVDSKQVLEIGAGTSLPGIVAAKLGASVTLTDDIRQPKCLDNCRKSCEANNIETVNTLAISWGIFTPSMVTLPPQDILLASDCFYDSKDFEDVIATIKFFMEKNNSCECWVTYQQRSADRSIEYLLQKWNLSCCHHPLRTFNADTPCIGGSGLPGNHSIEMLVITNSERAPPV